MPQVYNGTGTWYYGKDNRHFHTGTCEHCGAHGHLASYDTTLYFTFLFVPLIPLRRKRVIDECPTCKRHRVMNLKDWVQTRHTDIRTAVEALRESPEDSEKALAAIGMAISYQHKESYEVIKLLVSGSLAENAQAQAAIGSAASYFGRLEEAEEAYRKSLAVEDKEEVREALAVTLLRLNRPVEASPLLEHIFTGETPERWGLASLLAMAYQAEGAHEEALDLLDRCEKQWPLLASRKDLKHLRNVSMKYRDRARKIPAPLLTPPPKGDESETYRRASRLARLVGPAVAVLLIGWYLGAAYLGGVNRKVHLINATGVAYEVSIDGAAYQLHPMHRKEVEISEGELTIEVRHPGVESKPEKVRIETGFFSRPFVSSEFVINPDRTAIIVREEAVYSEHPEQEADEGTWSASVGQLVHTFERIHYPFRDFPDEITLSSGRSERRSRIYLYREDPQSALMVAATGGRDAAADYLKNSLAYNPASTAHLRLLSSVLPPEEIVSITRPRLSDRPVRTEWHRLYQRMTEMAEPDRDLEREYALLLESEPNSSTLQYLAGQVTRDDSRSDQLLIRSTRGDRPCAYGYAALAYRRLGSARFEEALSFIREATRLAPDEARFKEIEADALLALGRYDKLLAANAAARKAEPFDLDLVVRRIDLLVGLGNSPGARELIDQHCAALRNEGADDAWVEVARNYLTAMYHYRLGREQSAGELLAKLEGSENEWQASLCQGKTSDASTVVTSAEVTDFATHLLIFISARLDGDTALAERHLEAAVRDLDGQGYAARRASAWLSGTEAPHVDEAKALVMDVAHKRIVLTAMGLVFPRDKKKYFELAMKLNYDASFPHHLLKRAHEFPGL